MPFKNRVEAGRRLAGALTHLQGSDAVVLGLQRGGVPVAFEVAQALNAALDVIVVRKLGLPFQPELAMGAVGEAGVMVLNPDVLRAAHVDADELAAVEQAARADVDRCVHTLRSARPRISLTGRIAIVVDDGVATGATVRAACQVARAKGAARVVVAVPVAPAHKTATLGLAADEVVCLETPARLSSVGAWYDEFPQITDHGVVALLRRAAGESVAAAAADDPPGSAGDEVAVEAGPVRLHGRLIVPSSPVGMVVFAHGSGNSRHTPRNRYVADRLHQVGAGALLFDLLTPEEEVDWRNVFNIALLAGRLVHVIGWLRRDPALGDLPIGLFAASTGAAAALWAATEPNAGAIAAIVSRGGRPDLAIPCLSHVSAPTLLIVGGRDDLVLNLNRAAQTHLRCPNRLTVIPGATHLFEEPGTLQTVTDLTRDWFAEHLSTAALPQPVGQ